MRYLSVPEAACLWKRSSYSVQMCCRRGLIPGAFKNGRGWWRIPETEEPDLPRMGKLTDAQRREIARLGHEGTNRSKLAQDHEITRTHVYHLMREYPPGESA